MLLLVGFAAVRVAAFTLIYHGLLGIGVSLDNPIGDDPADLPGLGDDTRAVLAALGMDAAEIAAASGHPQSGEGSESA